MKIYEFFIPVLGVLLCGLASAEVTSSDQGDAKIQSSKGGVAVDTIIKKPDKECPTGITKKCVPDQPCVTNIEISGEAAKQLWMLLQLHGTKTTDPLGDYVGTNTGALTCWENKGTYNCTIG